MTPQQPSRARFTVTVILAAILAAVMAAAAAGLVLSRAHPAAAVPPGSTAAPAAPVPGTTQAQADLAAMQSVLNSGSVARQAALLAPPLKFASGSGPIVPSGQTITISPGTLHASGQRATVRARLSDGTAVTLGLYSVSGHWRLYGAQAGSAQTRAAVTGQPASARLMASVTSVGRSAWQAGAYQAVIEVHGFGERASDWDKSGMTKVIGEIPGVRVLKFDYSQVDTKWVTNPDIGPALADYIHQVAKASGRPVIVVGFSMGGLAIRYAATTGGRAGDIAMVITIGTPNTGSGWGNAHDVVCAGVIGDAISLAKPGFCTQWQAADAMAAFSPQILTLPKLPPSVPLHAIAGDWTWVFSLLGSQVAWPFGGDAVVSLGSALDKRPGWQHDTFDTVANPFVLDDMSAFHLNLTSNPNVQALVDRYISDYLRAHPVQARAAPAPTPAAPQLGGDAYWLAGGGQWYVHGATLQISRAAATNSEADLTGLFSWNDYQNTVWGHAVLRLSLQQDGSLAGTFVGSATYTLRDGSTAQGYAPQPDAPTDGQAIHLVPVGPMHAKVQGGYFGNTNWCQAGLANASQYCGA